ncbi:unnamed protein product [Nesidiocoris tenuis]|uniref:Uncharacterized protein n=1 Tax=Nesidiocoris tenuis TaxID=355587 RepID=A0A6H5GCD7_9HEMI|nr:unnamed protein product [Nesidiocoris tenuis]
MEGDLKIVNFVELEEIKRDQSTLKPNICSDPRITKKGPIPLSGSKTSGSGTCSVTEQFETEQSVAPLVEPEATARPSGSGRIILSFDWLSDPTVTDVKKFRNPNFSPPCRTIVASWTVNEEIEITYAVQARPALWNVASREYKQAPLKALMWAEVDTRRLGSQVNVSMVPDACQVQRDLERDRKKAFENSQKVHERNKRRIDKHRKIPTFEVGNMVYVNHGNSLNRNKLAEIRTGPFKILEKTSQSIYKIDSGYRKTESNYFHVSKLYPYSKE